MDSLKFLEEVNLDSFEMFNEEINNEEIIWDMYPETGAVWGIVSKNGILDVHSTSNIRNEMLSYQKYISYAKKILEYGNIKDIKDDKIKSKVGKLCKMLKENGDITFVIYFYSQEEDERLLVESTIAYQNKCKYWILHKSQLPTIIKKFKSLEKREKR